MYSKAIFQWLAKAKKRKFNGKTSNALENMLKAPQKTCKTFYDYSLVEMSNNICS